MISNQTNHLNDVPPFSLLAASDIENKKKMIKSIVNDNTYEADMFCNNDHLERIDSPLNNQLALDNLT